MDTASANLDLCPTHTARPDAAKLSHRVGRCEEFVCHFPVRQIPVPRFFCPSFSVPQCKVRLGRRQSAAIWNSLNKLSAAELYPIWTQLKPGSICGRSRTRRLFVFKYSEHVQFSNCSSAPVLSCREPNSHGRRDGVGQSGGVNWTSGPRCSATFYTIFCRKSQIYAVVRMRNRT